MNSVMDIMRRWGHEFDEFRLLDLEPASPGRRGSLMPHDTLLEPNLGAD